MVKGKRSCSWNNVLSTQYHYRLYLVTVLVIDRLRRRRFRLWGWPRSTQDPFYHRYRFFFCLLFAIIWWMIRFDEFSRYNTISSAARWKTLGNYDGLVDKLCLAALGSDFCWPSLSKFFLCQPQFLSACVFIYHVIYGRTSLNTRSWGSPVCMQIFTTIGK